MSIAGADEHAPTKLFGRDFVVLAVASMLMFGSFGMTLPVLPRYVADVLGGGDALVGFAFGVHAISAIAVRPFVGRIGDRYGRRVIVTGGAVVCALGFLGHLLATTVFLLIVARLIVGAGLAAFMVGATTLAMDFAPPDRRGEASSYVLVAVHIGSATGPLLGEWLRTSFSFDAVWVGAAAGMGVSALVAAQIRDVVEPSGFVAARARLIHPSGVYPGVVLLTGIVGVVGFNAFIPLYGEEVGLANVALVFLVSSVVIALARVLAGRLPDTLGPVRGGTFALGSIAVGLAVVALWATPAGVFSGTAVMALGSAMLFPSLAAAAVAGAPANERAAVMATFTMFIDLSNAAAGPLLGIVAGATSFGDAYLVAACIAVGGIALLRVLPIAGAHASRGSAKIAP